MKDLLEEDGVLPAGLEVDVITGLETTSASLAKKNFEKADDGAVLLLGSWLLRATTPPFLVKSDEEMFETGSCLLWVTRAGSLEADFVTEGDSETVDDVDDALDEFRRTGVVTQADNSAAADDDDDDDDVECDTTFVAEFNRTGPFAVKEANDKGVNEDAVTNDAAAAAATGDRKGTSFITLPPHDPAPNDEIFSISTRILAASLTLSSS